MIDRSIYTPGRFSTIRESDRMDAISLSLSLSLEPAFLKSPDSRYGLPGFIRMNSSSLAGIIFTRNMFLARFPLAIFS